MTREIDGDEFSQGVAEGEQRTKARAESACPNCGWPVGTRSGHATVLHERVRAREEELAEVRKERDALACDHEPCDHEEIVKRLETLLGEEQARVKELEGPLMAAAKYDKEERVKLRTRVKELEAEVRDSTLNRALLQGALKKSEAHVKALEAELVELLKIRSVHGTGTCETAEAKVERLKNVVQEANARYHRDIKSPYYDYPPFGLTPWEDRVRWSKFIQKIIDEIGD